MKQLQEKLKALRHIAPDGNFHLRSKPLTSALPQLQKSLKLHLWESIRYSFALGLGALLLITMLGKLGNIHWSGLQPVIVGGLQTRTLAAEEEKTNFNLQIAEAKYAEENADAVARALDVVSENTDHLNNELLEQELQKINEEQPAS